MHRQGTAGKDKWMGPGQGSRVATANDNGHGKGGGGGNGQRQIGRVQVGSVGNLSLNGSACR